MLADDLAILMCTAANCSPECRSTFTVWASTSKAMPPRSPRQIPDCRSRMASILKDGQNLLGSVVPGWHACTVGIEGDGIDI